MADNYHSYMTGQYDRATERIAALEEQLAVVTAERDRLRDALQRLVSLTPQWGGVAMHETREVALAALDAPATEEVQGG